MRPTLQLLAVFLVGFAATDQDYTPLLISVIRPVELGNFSPKIEEGLANAIYNLSGIISVLDYGSRIIDFETIRKCSHGFQRTNRIRLVKQNNKKLCEVNKRMMASASPCGVSDGKRPLIGVVNICPGSRWKYFHAGVDLFRHELLHTLGYGTLNAVSPSMKGPEPMKYAWSDRWDGSSAQKVKRQFLDFASKALEEARLHLNCSTLVGVEADSADKIHLNEYVYGNELMTPDLSNVSNRFTYISAAILEGTYLGERPWYRVNRSAIRCEHESFWYGRQWGCTFAERSCLDYINERIREKKPTFPFCSKKDFNIGKMTFNLQQGEKRKTATAKCGKYPMMPGAVADNGVKAYPLSTRTEFGKVVGSPSKCRFCPLVKVQF
ncbi:hypothetical protein Q1695_010974 [Nippostrongylus brasiliensis]|nr:hypothetical protein Q1695_010974 [Nippostrongylus brasiliensis]